MSGLALLDDPGAVVFDLDGTLVDTVEMRIQGWLATFAEVGIPAERDFVARLIGSDGKRLAVEVAHLAGRHLDDDRAEAIDRRAGEIFDRLNVDPRPVRGARTMLVALERSELAWAIATSSRAAQVKKSVAALGLPEEPLIVDGSHVKHAKPAPDLLLLAADRLQTQARRCWYVGDATWDMVAARAAGIIGIGVPYGSASVADLRDSGAQATATFRSLLADLRRRGLIGAD
jgi:HAD superfamily hydrolase (TIGR01509 family)